MEDNQRRSALARISDATRSGLKSSVGTVWFLLKMIVPVTLAVAVLEWLGILAWIADFMGPAMGLVGLPGDAALVFISSIFLNIYSAIAVASTIQLDLRAATILALMCLTAHNLIVETAVMKKTGSSATKMAVLRIGIAFVGAFALDLLLPVTMASFPFSYHAGATRPDLWAMLAIWGLSTLKLVAKIVAIVVAIMVAQRLLSEFKVMDFLSRLFSPLMRLFGLPREASFLWIVINLVGYAYGAGIVQEQIKEGRMKAQEGDLFNHHAAICHSLLEDSVLYIVVGIGAFWIIVPRLILAFCVVWLERIRRRFFRRSFRVGTV